jgi:hypothetical protein
MGAGMPRSGIMAGARHGRFGERMNGRRVRFGWLVLWTLIASLVAAAVVMGALVSLLDADQACFFGYPSVPCPGPDDPAIRILRLACIGLPSIWGAGIVVLAWAGGRFHRRRHPAP